jgi:membrane-associated phospholipid phosphatase
VGGEEILQQGPAFVFPDAGVDLHPMIEPALAEDIEHRTGCTGLLIPSAENYPRNSGEYYGTRAHGTRLQGDHERAVRQPPAVPCAAIKLRQGTQSVRRLADGHDFGVRCGVTQLLPLVPSRTQHPAVGPYDNCADGHVLRGQSQTGLIEGKAHPLAVFLFAGRHASMIVSRDIRPCHPLTQEEFVDVDRFRGRVGQWFKPYAALWITMLVGGVLVVIMALLGAEVYDNVVDDAGLANLDKPSLAFAEDLRSPWLDSVVTGFTNIGGGIGMPILASILVAWLTYMGRTWRPLILVGGAAAFSVTATTIGKKLVGRTRPDHADAVPPYEDSPSFPSGHTLNTTVVIGLVVYLACLQFERTVVRVSMITGGTLFIIAMGLSRVFLGHHWLTDVIAAWLLGLAWVGIVILAHRLFHVLRKREHAGPAPTFEHHAIRDDQPG